MDEAPGQSLFDDVPEQRTSFAYGLGSRVWAVTVMALASVPLIYVLAFLVTHVPPLDELGPVLLVLLFLLAPPIFAALRYGDAFRRFDVQPYRLQVTPLLRPWAIRWKDISRIVRRSAGRGAYQPFKVSLEIDLGDGKSAWVALFDSSLPGADELYAQIVAHTPHIRPKELVDETRWPGRRQ
ncbi:MAG: hypothetical protein KDI07_19750 [Anaerolineae bacterium]|nr:hypothetical protein [Anaerolineae bacterium]MCB0236059.1 hypothetical protein [Anaerolineae bacterium]MCB0243424.1 hypothetical protein [Anaerolineae bacterium]MCB0250819.1 hypothetical protein [Anaerolineae bacterium]MCO5244854.1 hypothetical protein [Anaerolineae bacterium]